ncbi:MAG: ABC transporter ATP-binding protein [Hespellia sp.]|nr:ABC transporter ATP-binding protein [Hespellia sp.]
MSHIHIDVEDVSFGYEKNKNVLSNLNFTARERDCIGLIGANGMGKSTLLKLMVGLESGFSGNIHVEEIPVIPQMFPKIREKIGYVFQDSESQLFMNKVSEDIAFAPRNYGMPESEVQVCVERALSMVHIEHLREKSIYKLSGGEKKLVAIATILAMTPDIILMDEPTIALDPKNRRNLIHILNQFNHLRIIASHDLDMVMDTCNRVILMSEGRIVADGAVMEILTDQKLLEDNGLELPLRLQNGGNHL